MKTKAHMVFAIVAFLTILIFWTSTVLAELFGSHSTVMLVKRFILYGIIVLVPSMAATAALGRSLAAGRSTAALDAKRRRMPFIAANGVLVLLPCAVTLERLASSAGLGLTFYTIQMIELAAGAVNLSLMFLNIRDGLRMTGRLCRSAVRPRSQA